MTNRNYINNRKWMIKLYNRNYIELYKRWSELKSFY